MIAAVLASTGDDDDRQQDAGGGAGEIFLEPVAAVGRDPFTESVAAPPPTPPTIPPNTPVTIQPAGPLGPAVTAPALPGGSGTTLPPSAPSGGGTAAISTIRGSTPGLYGGTGSQQSCNQQQMINYLTANPSLGRAWADVQGITQSEIPAYINSLTPVLLRSDTRVTNHGFSQGRATPKQSVLQAGTAVLVDDKGVPRARCACGNPLVPPQSIPTGPVYVGPKWPGFNPQNVTVIQSSTTTINVITVINIKTGEPYGVPKGGGPPMTVPPNTTTTTSTTTTSTTTTTTRPTTPTSGPPENLACGTTANSGGEGVTTKIHQLARNSGTFQLNRDAYSVPDRFEVFYEGRLIFDSGVVSGQQTHTITYGPGRDTSVTVRVTGDQSGTQWQYTVSCPT